MIGNLYPYEPSFHFALSSAPAVACWMTLIRALLWLALIASLLLAGIVYAIYVWHNVFPAANKARRQKVLRELGVKDDNVTLAGLFHPYW